MGNYLSMSYYAFMPNIANQNHEPIGMTKIESENQYVSSCQSKYECVYKYIKSKSKQKINKALIFCHGNACTISSGYVETFTNFDLNADVYLLEYPGFGEFIHNEYPSKENIRNCLHYLYSLINLKYETIIFLGHSIGTAVVLDYLHTYNINNPCILLAPFMSIQTLVLGSSSSLIDDYVNYENIKHLDKKNVAIFHGKQDTVIPYQHSIQLSNGKYYVKIIDATHNDILTKIEIVSLLKNI